MGTWADVGDDPHVAAFHEQLQHVVPLPRVPEWEQITTKIMQAGQAVIAGQTTVDEALAGPRSSKWTNFSNKRRWMLARHEAD